MKHQISVAILAGGQSRRMGRNKALLPLPPSGESMLHRICRRVGPITDDVMIIAPALPPFAGLPARVVPDLVPGHGPLAGIAAALAAASHQTCLIVACDLPLLQPALLEYFLELGGTGTWDAVVPRLADPAPAGWQPLLALYHARCLPVIHRLLAAQRRRVHELLDEISVRAVPESTLRRYDPELLSFINVNDPESYRRVCALLEQIDR